jgi:phosphatidylserine decarboxylase
MGQVPAGTSIHMSNYERIYTDAVQTPESAKVLGDHTQGWFGPVGLHDLVEVANKPNGTDMKFEDVFHCDASAKYYGYKSWDGKISPPPT